MLLDGVEIGGAGKVWLRAMEARYVLMRRCVSPSRLQGMENNENGIVKLEICPAPTVILTLLRISRVRLRFELKSQWCRLCGRCDATETQLSDDPSTRWHSKEVEALALQAQRGTVVPP